MRRVVLTFLPSSLKRYDITVLVPSLLVATCWGGRVLASSNSSSSAQSGRLERCKLFVRMGGREEDVLCYLGHVFGRVL